MKDSGERYKRYYRLTGTKPTQTETDTENEGGQEERGSPRDEHV